MKITVIGTGYVGLVAGLGFADFGHNIVCLDVDSRKIELLQNGICPIYEPGAEHLLKKNSVLNRIKFTTNAKEAIEFGDVVFIGVGTPQDENGEADLTAVYATAKEIGTYINGYKVIVDKSTVPIGTAQEVKAIIQKELDKRNETIEFSVASNPEFLREGKAISDFINPDRIVLGVEDPKAEKILKKVYSLFERSNKPLVITNIATAEMIKYASNAFLATKISFINEIANLCEVVGADALQVAAAMGKDGRISPKFLHPGPGYGGSCFPKDTRAILTFAQKNNVNLKVIDSVIEANEDQKLLAAEKIKRRFPEGAVICILGVAFKPETDDIRESPSVAIIKSLSEYGNFSFKLYDPQAMEEAREKDLKGYSQVEYYNNIFDACEGADAIAIITEWFEFRNLDWQDLSEKLNNKVLFDFRNVYKRTELESLGYEYFGVGV